MSGGARSAFLVDFRDRVNGELSHQIFGRFFGIINLHTD